VSCANNLVVCSLLCFRCIDPLFLPLRTCSFFSLQCLARGAASAALPCTGVIELRATRDLEGQAAGERSHHEFAHAIALEPSTNIRPNDLSIPNQMPRTCTRGTRKSRARGQHWRHMTETRIPLYRCNSGRSSWSRTRDEARATIHVNHTWTKIFRLFLAATSSLEIETKRMIQDEEGAVAIIMI